MEPKIVKANSPEEQLTPERCFVMENWGKSTQDTAVSIARARVEPGISTKAHHLEGVQEMYLIASGSGRVHVSGLEATEVSPGDLVVIPEGVAQQITNIGESDLIFYCICTPAFTQECYRNDEA